jgi:Ca-activated chloride channel homolog
MSFARPDLLFLVLLLPAAVLSGLLLFLRRRRRVLQLLGEPALLARLGLHAERFPGLRAAALVVAAACIAVAASGPRWGVRAEEVRSQSLQAVLVLDISRSMLVRDIEPDRLERQRLLARRIVRGMEGDRIGLVAFSGRAHVLSPLTVDHSAIHLYLDAIEPGIASQGGSSFTSALRQATGLLTATPEIAGARVILLLSDGEPTEPMEPIFATARRAAEQRIVIHTVGIGSTAGGPVPILQAETGGVVGYVRDESGNVHISRMHEEVLRRIAATTGGMYLDLSDPGATSRLLGAVGRMERGAGAARGRVLPRERYRWFLLAALVLVCAEALLGRRSVVARVPETTADVAEEAAA